MNEADSLRRLVQSALPPVLDGGASRDLWPALVARGEHARGWSWWDAGLAALAALVTLLSPGALVILAYHL